LQGSLKYCSKCGYKLEEQMEDPYAEDRGSSSGAKNNKTGSEVTPSPTGERIVVEEEERRIPPGARVKSRVPKSTTCSVCNIKTEDICYFCDYAVCGQHSVKMQVCADKSEIGNIIQSCPKCATKREGNQPSKDEASGIGFFFNIKPYHEWKILD
jgi:hypothetical protein